MIQYLGNDEESMTTLTIHSTNRSIKQTASKLIKNALQREQELLKMGLEKTLKNLSKFEKKYNMSSKQFFKDYQNGRIDDRNDYVDWAGECQIYESLNAQMKVIKEIKV